MERPFGPRVLIECNAILLPRVTDAFEKELGDVCVDRRNVVKRGVTVEETIGLVYRKIVYVMIIKSRLY